MVLGFTIVIRKYVRWPKENHKIYSIGLASENTLWYWFKVFDSFQAWETATIEKVGRFSLRTLSGGGKMILL